MLAPWAAFILETDWGFEGLWDARFKKMYGFDHTKYTAAFSTMTFSELAFDWLQLTALTDYGLDET